MRISTLSWSLMFCTQCVFGMDSPPSQTFDSALKWGAEQTIDDVLSEALAKEDDLERPQTIRASIHEALGPLDACFHFSFNEAFPKAGIRLTYGAACIDLRKQIALLHFAHPELQLHEINQRLIFRKLVLDSKSTRPFSMPSSRR
jgi:hypothetical protein